MKRFYWIFEYFVLGMISLSMFFIVFGENVVTILIAWGYVLFVMGPIYHPLIDGKEDISIF